MRARLVVIMVAVAAIGVVTPVSPAVATWPGSNGAIAFGLTVSDCRDYCTNWSEIAITDRAGEKPPLRLAGSDERYDAAPEWSPDGNRIAFVGYPYGVAYRDIYTMSPTGGALDRLTNNYTNLSPQWSPNGRKIAFVRDDGEGWGRVWVMNADGSNQVEVPIAYYAHEVSWLPDGRITFWGHGDDFYDPSFVNGLFVTNVAGTSVEEITSLDDIGAATGQGQGWPSGLDWSPDGQLGIFAASVPVSEPRSCSASPDNQQDIWSVTPTGELAPVHTSDGEFEMWESTPVWSPNGARIAFVANSNHCEGEGRDQVSVAGPSAMYTMKVDGTDERKIVDPPSGDGYGHGVGSPSWQPCTAATVRCGRPAGEGGWPIQDEVPPVVETASRRVPQGAALGAFRAPVRFAWSGSDDETAVADLRFDAQVREVQTSTWEPLVTNVAQPSVTAMLAPGKEYELRHRARDEAGNVSPWLVSSEFRLNVVDEDATSPVLRTSGTWQRVDRLGAYGGHVRTSNGAGATATLTFGGRRGVGVAMPQAEGLGVASVCLRQNGTNVACSEVDLGTETSARQIVFARNALTRSLEYELRVRVVSGRVEFDAFELLS